MAFNHYRLKVLWNAEGLVAIAAGLAVMIVWFIALTEQTGIMRSLNRGPLRSSAG